ncbi:polysaccharide deacetylase family protein [Clostridium sp. C8-1-8]|uniref:polysaccharide deacetylase family protein n=1 Tax=Clostridium sp. C8-1-8 TaxID=2698831 RepID=UPI001367E546|nr:polysaccharide deacetylase family protein [Clostridium sp. C8-1-8]
MKRISKFFIFILTSILLTNLSGFEVLATEENNPEQKVVYLTFDDGPSGKLNSKVLDILKEKNVHATFFLIGNMIKGQEALVKRMVDEGNSVGLHTYSHEKDKIYRNNTSFVDEMLLTQQIIYDATGVKTNILRFPFGCNNNIYKLTTSMVTALHDNNFKIYDWNVDTTDGMNPKLAPYKILTKAKSDKNPAVVLMHCGYLNKNTAIALPEIIDYYKSKGYEFKVITEDTPEVYKLRKNR